MTKADKTHQFSMAFCGYNQQNKGSKEGFSCTLRASATKILWTLLIKSDTFCGNYPI